MSNVSPEPVLVTQRQYEVLQFLTHQPDRAIGEIAALLEISSAAATKLVDRLQRKGYVKRTVDEMDRRTIRVRVTRVGQEVFRRATHQTERARG